MVWVLMLPSLDSFAVTPTSHVKLSTVTCTTQKLLEVAYGGKYSGSALWREGRRCHSCWFGHGHFGQESAAERDRARVRLRVVRGGRRRDVEEGTISGIFPNGD